MLHRSPDLYLHEQILLLALRDEEGTIESRADRYPLALGGAILAELVLHGRLALTEDELQSVGVSDHSPLPDPVLDEALTTVLKDGETRPSIHWVERFSSIEELKHKVARELCERGILKDSLDKVLLVFSRKIYPEQDHEPEQKLIDSLRAAIFSEKKDVDPRIAILVSLAHTAGILDVHFESGDLKRRAERLADMRDGEVLPEMEAEALALTLMAQRAVQTVVGIQ